MNDDLVGRLRPGDWLILKGETIKTRRGMVTSPDRRLQVEAVTATHIKFTDGGGWNRANPEPWPLFRPTAGTGSHEESA